jgi:hypothetical protein
MMKFILFLFASLSSNLAIARDILVLERPIYEAGEYVVIEADSVFGPISIRIESKKNIRKYEHLWTLFNVSVSAQGSQVLSTQALLDVSTFSGHLRYEGVVYRVDSDLSFPIFEGDSFSQTLFSSQACRRPEYRGKTCMEVDEVAQCFGLRRASRGIGFVCRDGAGIETEYVMDHEFKWLLEFRTL